MIKKQFEKISDYLDPSPCIDENGNIDNEKHYFRIKYVLLQVIESICNQEIDGLPDDPRERDKIS